MASDARRAAERRGRRAEAIALFYLRAKGYRLLGRRYKTPVGEIDLIVARGKVVAFVEVKARPTDAQAAEAATPTGRRRVARAASSWLAKHPEAAERELRLDVIVAVPWRLPRHIIGAFDADGAA